ncbi:uncharacterized protein LOC129719879 [Wyeomyia smithii]|uniref:uncharacterized protein LOC129719879 n=1 Tax=Wyeomyia smithii TaxID=174621 RepID=UPI0024681CBA|nr:uncharacterized protein LOC129719879 [Wyeomyia smithii]
MASAHGEQPNKDANCRACQRPDDAEDMVQCDQCDCWQHFTCAGVRDDVTNRSWACGKCNAMEAGETISLMSKSSRASSTFSIDLSNLVEKQRLERARVELELQRRHLDEQQKLIANAVEGNETRSQCSEIFERDECHNATATCTPPAAPRVASDRRSPMPLETPRSILPPMVSIPLAVLSRPVSRSLSGMDERRKALIKLKDHVELCEARATPTPEQLSELQAQLESRRKMLEKFQPGGNNRESFQHTEESSSLNPASVKAAVNKPCWQKPTGAIPKTERTLPTVPFPR